MVLVEIAPPDYDVEVYMVYATEHNFTGRPIYRRPGCYLNPEAAEALARAIDLAAAIGLRFKIYDAFRPVEAHRLLWQHTPDPQFVAEPSRGSPHSRGAAVDVALIDDDGSELEMGTAVDTNEAQAHHGRTDVSEAAQRNRLTLLGLMTAAGWDHYRYEWWHYQLFDARRYPLLADRAAGTRMM